MKKLPILNTPPGSDEEDRVVADFVQKLFESDLRQRYATKLAATHGVELPPEDVTTASIPNIDIRPRLLSRRFYLTVAAGVALLIAAFFLFTGGEDEFDSLLAQNLAVESYYLPFTRGESPAAGSRLEAKLLLDYGAGHFDRVVARQGATLTPVGRFYLSLALIVKGRMDEARVQLANIPAEDKLRAEADWFSLMLELQDGATPRELEKLRAYGPEDIAYYRRAQQLLAALPDTAGE